jgi:CubicO group peptidase (beta-lactamase class C family)
VLIGGAGLATLAIGGCANAGSTGESFDWTLRSPADTGIRPDGSELIRNALQTSMDAHEGPGAVAAVARGDKLAFFEAAGLRVVETAEPMRKDDLFRMMSSTKPVTAVAVLMMQDAGKLSIDDPVSKFIPSFRNPRVATLSPELLPLLADSSKHADLKAKIRFVAADREFTIKDLLTHTSGLSSGLGLLPGPASLAGGVPLQLTADTLATRVPRFGELALDFQPGSRFSYSPGDGFDTLLHIVELTSGLPADVFLRERLFNPLEMVDTGFVIPLETQPRLVPLYSRKSGVWQPATPLTNGDASVTYFSGAGGLISSVHDFLHFEKMLLQRGVFRGRRILKPETVDQMSTNQVGSLFAEWIPPFTKGLGFGLGVRIVIEPGAASARTVGSFGWGGAYGTESWVDPARELAVVNFMQCADGRGADNAEYFAKALMQAFPVA